MVKLDPALLRSGKIKDPSLEPWMQRLYKLHIYGRWITVVSLWMLVGLPSLWSLRSEIELLREYFTWAAVRYGLIFNRVPSFGLFLCFGVTAAVLVWQGRNWMWGLPNRERMRLERQARWIRKQGPKHPLWRWVSDARS